jgi:cell division protein FtsN
MAQSESSFEREQEEAAAAEAASIGGHVSDEPPAEDAEELDPAQRPLIEAGEGESEGFEQAERALIEHASHGDQHAARRVIADAFDEDADARATRAGEPDTEQEPDL